MGMFDFWKYSGAEAAEVIDVTHQLASRTAADPFSAFDFGTIAQSVVSTPEASGTTDPRGGIPDGWREIDPTEMGFTADEIGYNDYIKVDSPVIGDVDGTVQFKVFVSDAGQLSVSWAATNNPLDVIDFTKLNTGEVGALMDDALTKVASYAQSLGMTADDVLVTGYSLGGAYTSIMAENQGWLADGFFDQATYVSHNGPIVAEGVDNIVYYGHENDIVHRAAGDFDTIQEALSAAGPLLEGSDFNFEASIDNVIVFDGAYASPLFPFGPFSILNLPGAWYGHLTGVFTDAVQRIGQSTYYDLTNRDSAMVISALGEDLRTNTWVEDKKTLASSDHFGKSAFLVGTNYDDLLRDGKANDFVDGMQGNDLVRLSSGYDVVDGGEGNDTVRLKGYANEWRAFQLSDGSVAFHSNNGNGLKIVENTEAVEFEGLAIGDESTFNKRYFINDDELRFDGNWWDRLWNSDKGYDWAHKGTDGDDVIQGQTVFAMDGDDNVTGTAGDDLLVGGFGEDVLNGGDGNDQLYGGAHDDLLLAGDGYDILNGGHGTDTFHFRADDSGHKVIEDFNQALGEVDLLRIDQFDSLEDLKAAATQHDDSVRIIHDDLRIDIAGITIDDLTAQNTVFDEIA